jgi:hypothetical protein
MSTTSSQGSTFTIEEITGSRGWSVTLTGAALPHQGAGWEAENRLPTEFYQGNPVGTQQVIGPKEGPSHWEGLWHRTMLLRSPATITPSGQSTLTATPTTLAGFLEQLFLGGARLRVTWTANKTEQIPNGAGGTSSGNPLTFQIVREGRAARWKFTPLTVDDVKWEVSWKWVSRGGSQQTVVATRDGDPSAQAAQVQAALTDAIALTGTLSPQAATNPLVPLSATPDTLGEYETLSPGLLTTFAGFNASMLQLQVQLAGSAALAVQVGQTPSQINNSILNLSTQTIVTCNGFVDSVGETPFEVQSTSSAASDVLYAAAAISAAGQQALMASEAAEGARERAATLVSANPGGGGQTAQQTLGLASYRIRGIYRTRDGDTPMSVAAKIYGDPDRALDLLQANHCPLGQPSFQSGTVLMLPVLRSSTASG